MGKNKNKHTKGKARKNNSNRNYVKSKIKSKPLQKPEQSGKRTIRSKLPILKTEEPIFLFDDNDHFDDTQDGGPTAPGRSPQVHQKLPQRAKVDPYGKDPRLQDLIVTNEDLDTMAALLKEEWEVTDDVESTTGAEEETQWEGLETNIDYLMGLGFSDLNALSALENSLNRVEGALEWLCLHLEPYELPPGFAPKKTTKFEVISHDLSLKEKNEKVTRLEQYGFGANKIKNALEQTKDDETEALYLLLRALYNNPNPSTSYDTEELSMVKEQREYEIEACNAIWESDFSVISEKLMNVRFFVDGVDGENILEFHIPENCAYPLDMPLVAFRNSKIFPELVFAINKKMAEEAQNYSGQPLMHTVYEWLKENVLEMYSQFKKGQRDGKEEQRGRGNKGPGRGGRGGNRPENQKSIKVINRIKQLMTSVTDDEEDEDEDDEDEEDDDKENTLNVPTYHPKVLSPEQQKENLKQSLLMINNMREKHKNPNFLKYLAIREKLPAWKVRTQIINTIFQNQVVLISGETGSGKTTQVGQIILDEMIRLEKGAETFIICTQPRRLSAISVAERVAEERASKIGDIVGYSIRLENKTSANTRLLFCTTGILLRRLQSDLFLEQVSHLIVDEIHERDLNSDFLLIILRNLLSKRPNLKLILMSATLNSETFSKYFNSCPKLEIPGFVFPVTEYYLEDILNITNYSISPGSKYYDTTKANTKFEYLEKQMPGYSPKVYETLHYMNLPLINYDLIEALIVRLSSTLEEGGFLVFLPGLQEITTMCSQLEESRSLNSSKFRILPLHSSLTNLDQQMIFTRPPPGIRKIIISTNIAETSITIDDIVAVIDSCKVKEMQYDAGKKMSCLVETWASQSSCRQRRGRAGRVKPGHCFYMVTRQKMQKLAPYQLPEMSRVCLDELCLQIVLLNLGSISSFLSNALEPPDQKGVEDSIQNLQALNALDQNQQLTPLGMHLAQLPVSVSLGKMLIFGAIFGCLEPILTICATIAERSPFVAKLENRDEADQVRQRFAGVYQSDHISVLNAYQEWKELKSRNEKRQFSEQNYLSQTVLYTITDLKIQFRQLLSDLGFNNNNQNESSQNGKNNNNMKLINAVVSAGLYPHVAYIHPLRSVGTIGKKIKYALYTKDQRRVFIHPSSVVARARSFEGSRWLTFGEKVQTTKIYLHQCSVVSPVPLVLFGGDISQSPGRNFLMVDKWIAFNSNERTGVLLAGARRRMDKLLLEKIQNPSLDLSEDKLIAIITKIISNEK